MSDDRYLEITDHADAVLDILDAVGDLIKLGRLDDTQVVDCNLIDSYATWRNQVENGKTPPFYVTDHAWVGIQDHPDDDECSFVYETGTSWVSPWGRTTKVERPFPCCESEENHKESTR